MAAWDALAKAAAVLLGGSVGPVTAYNSNGLWLREPKTLAAEAFELRDEGGFRGLTIRRGRETIRDDWDAIEAVRNAVGEDTPSWSISIRACIWEMHCSVATDWTILHAQLAAELKTPIQIGENF